MDEATTALDAESASAVLAGVRGAMEGRTLIIISHIGSTLAISEQIAVLGTTKAADPKANDVANGCNGHHAASGGVRVVKVMDSAAYLR